VPTAMWSESLSSDQGVRFWQEIVPDSQYLSAPSRFDRSSQGPEELASERSNVSYSYWVVVLFRSAGSGKCRARSWSLGVYAEDLAVRLVLVGTVMAVLRNGSNLADGKPVRDQQRWHSTNLGWLSVSARVRVGPLVCQRSTIEPKVRRCLT
jgi:hypothetical protein